MVREGHRKTSCAYCAPAAAPSLRRPASATRPVAVSDDARCR
nr:hypothetical protein JVH1_7146 [Rhodococcus sp. JVH1]